MMDFLNSIFSSETVSSALQQLLTALIGALIVYLQTKHIGISKQTLSIAKENNAVVVGTASVVSNQAAAASAANQVVK